MKVAVIYNKKSYTEDEVINFFGPLTREFYNQKTVNDVAEALEKGGHNVRTIDGNIHVADHLRDFMPKVLSGEKPGMVFNMAYGIQGQSRYTHIPAMLEMMGLPYVGSGPKAHAVALDKILTKIVLQQNGLPTPQFWSFASADQVTNDVVWPVIVKPKMEAVSMGLRVVDNIEDLREAVSYIVAQFQQEALAESFIPGREFAVGLLGNGQDLQALPIVEIDLKGDPDAIQTEAIKKTQPFEKICPAVLPDELSESMTELAIRAFQVLDLCDFARVDFRMAADGSIYILEVNSMASLGKTGSYTAAAAQLGYDRESLINRMLDVAAVRYFGRDLQESPSGKHPLRSRIRTYLRTQIDTLTGSLQKVVDMPTDVYNVEEINRLGTWFSQKMRKLGFQQRVFPQTEVGNMIWLSNHQDSKCDVLIIAHLDTPPGVVHASFSETRGRCYGTGVSGNKGGLITLLGACMALRYARRASKSRMEVLLVTDESFGVRFSENLIKETVMQARHVIGMKGGHLDGGIILSSPGSMRFELNVANHKDEEEHSKIISALCNKVLYLQKKGSIEKGFLIKPQSFQGSLGMKGPCSVQFEVSYNESLDNKDLEDNFRLWARKGLEPRYRVNIRKTSTRKPLIQTAQTHSFYEDLAHIAQQLELKVKADRNSANHCVCHAPTIPTLEGLGPVGAGAYTHHEFIIRDSLMDRAALLALTINHYGKDVR